MPIPATLAHVLGAMALVSLTACGGGEEVANATAGGGSTVVGGVASFSVNAPAADGTTCIARPDGPLATQGLPDRGNLTQAGCR